VASLAAQRRSHRRVMTRQGRAAFVALTVGRGNRGPRRFCDPSNGFARARTAGPERAYRRGPPKSVSSGLNCGYKAEL
jgi:hypothetical protein